MDYEIHILDDVEFNKLPYKDTKIALGMADPKTKIAYVRQTGIKHIDRGTLNHEFDELMQRVSPHEEDGIRYKIPILSTLFGAAKKVIGGIGRASLLGAQTVGEAAFKAFKSGGEALGGIGRRLIDRGGQAASFAASGGVGGGILPGGPRLAGAGNALGKFALSGAKEFAVEQASKQLRERLGSSSVTTGGIAQPSGFGGNAGALGRFANPVSNIGGDVGNEALKQSDVDEGFANIDTNANLRRKSIFDTFRGATPEGNSRFAQQLANINVGTQTEKDTFLSEANAANEKRNLGVRRNEIQRLNSLSTQQFDEFLELAKSGSNAAISAKVNQDPDEFRNVFKGFF